MFKHFLKSNKGFSLAEVMVAAGMLSIISLGVMQLTKNMTGSTKNMEADAEIIMVNNAISQLLMNSNVCTETLLGLNLPAGAGAEVALANIVKGGANRYSVGGEYGGINNFRTVRIESMHLIEIALVAAAGTMTGTANLRIIYRKLRKGVSGPPTSQKVVQVLVVTDPGRNVISCLNSDGSAVKTMCEKVGGTWVEADLQCDLEPAPAATLPSAAATSIVSGLLAIGNPNPDNVAVSVDFLKAVMDDNILQNDVRYIKKGIDGLDDSFPVVNVTTIGNDIVGDTINLDAVLNANGIFNSAVGFNSIGPVVSTGTINSTGDITSIGNIISTGTINSTGNITSSGDINSTGTITSNGHIVIAQNYYLQLSSDRTLKKNIKPLENVLEKMDKISGVSFDWKKSGDNDIGVIAQEIKSVFPEVVSTNPKTGKLVVRYSLLGAISIQAIKELKKENLSLKKELSQITKHLCKNNKELSFCKIKKAKKVIKAKQIIRAKQIIKATSLMKSKREVVKLVEK